MSEIFKKLNLKHQAEILVLNAPRSFEGELIQLGKVTVHESTEQMDTINFALVFVISKNELDAEIKSLLKKVKDDVTLWFAYPKSTSKKYQSEINRDNGWSTLGDAGFEGVRQIAIDEDWSALRFRRIEFIKSFTRDPKRALSLKGRARAINT